MRRVTIANASVTAASVIVCSVTRPTQTDADDEGFIYIANVVSRAAGTFDVVIACLDYGFDDPTESAPNETVTLNYVLS